MARLTRVALVVAACALAYDAARPPARQVSARVAVAGIHGYQRTISPALAGGVAMCRFTPTCSHYAETVIARDGIVRGGWSAVKRLARCGPWTPMGTVDRP